MVTCKEIYKNFKQLDIFGVTLAFSYNSKASHKTIFGSILTLILFSLLFYKLVLALKNLILKEQFDITLTESPAIDDTIEFKDIEIAVCPLFNIVLETNMDHLFNFTYEYTNDRGEPYRSETLSKDNCTKQVKFGNGKTYETKDYCHCVIFDEQSHFNITKNSILFADDYISVKIAANFQLAEQSLKESEETYGLLRTVLFLYQNNYVNTSNYYDLIRKYDTGIFDYMNIGAESFINLGADKIQVDDINDIYTFGLVDADITSNYSYNIHRKDSFHLEVNQGERYSAISYLIKHNGIITTYSIATFNLEKFLALFGGYFQVFFVLFSLISTFVNENSLEKKIENNFKKNTKFVDKLLKDLDEELLQASIHNTNNNHQLMKLDKEDQNNEEKINNRENNKFHFNSIQSLNIQKFQKINENPEEKPQENLVFLNNFNNSPSLNVTESKFSKNNLRRVPIRKQGRIINNEEYYKEIKDDFIAQLDYEKFYKLIKEIKLIKFFLLDIKSLQWIYKLEQFPLNIDKFEKFIQENHISQVELQSDDNLSNINKKLKVMKEFLVTFNIH